ncbi:plasmid partitioning protein RepB C-terminal domain-containing protein [Pseudacidovorax sp. RU35E]|uniref:plasmid partitioning protein RepB C-terminal domain-containing protein n=1 Tax=Pseudacidovorax sp. RU35E TaxID=1907403 RepID=UPI0009550C5E|nr:plasmid partitioning protein RepB C-terminal domain-containing protein [Pseudacidovorax sp. RU35E]SIR52141.1 chromosome partitioning protein, ParB family [Pseudacidovorax sp. RU35E]
MKSPTNKVQMIAIADITVANPRARNPRIHKTITDSIDQVGLKRPITVRRVPDGRGPTQYALICGQGRLESCVMLGQTEIPAIIVDVDEETAHLMSIVENVARRSPRSVETLEHVRALKRRGYSDGEVATKLGCTASWVNCVSHLLEHGERRLLAATEAGDMPLHLAVSISRSSDAEVQQLLIDAYESGELKGRKVTVVRKIIARRARHGKRVTAGGRGAARAQMTPDELARLYSRDVEIHRRIQKKAEFTQRSLLLAQQIFKELFSDLRFCAVLRDEGLVTVPKPLADLATSVGLD